MTTENKNALQAKEQQALVGIDKVFTAGTTLTFKGTSYTPATMKAAISADLAAAATTATAKAAVTVAVTNEKATRTTATQILTFIRDYILLTAGSDAVSTLQLFGLTPPKTPTKTVKIKANAVARGAETRKLRGTIGKKAKLEIQAPPVEETTTAPAALVAPSPSK
jgi:hypothetical protein